MKFCEECGAQLDDKVKFCPKCGNGVVKIPKLIVCEVCGEPVERDSNFCANCGAPFCIPEPFPPIGDTPNETEAENNSGGVWLRIFGIILMVTGAGLMSYGSNLNNSLEAQLNSLLSSGSTNPGTAWVTFGALGAVLGLVLLIASFRKD